MGLDLRLLILYDKDSNYSQDILCFNKRSKLFEKILELERRKGLKVSEKFRSFLGENSYQKTTKISYGSPLKYILIEDLLKYFSENGKFINDWKKQAIWSYLKKHPNYLKIALYWC